MKYIGLDLGTSGSKAVIFDETGRIIEKSFKGYNLITEESGVVELDPNDVWNAVVHVLREVSSKCKDKSEIKALSVSSFGEACIPIDYKGSILSNSIIATDSRGKEELKSITEKIEESKLIEITGLPLNSTYTINKILWIKNNKYEVFKKAWKFLLYQDFIYYKLCDEAVTDYSLASRTMAYDIRKNEWSKEILGIVDIDEKLFSKTISSGCIISDSISKVVAEELNLPKSIIVVLGGHDQPCSALGAGMINEGCAVDSIGTTECVTTVLRNKMVYSTIKTFNFPCEPFLEAGKYNTMAYLHTAGALLKWYLRVFDADRKSANEKGHINLYKYFDEMCPEKPTDLYILPHFSGTGTPHMNPFSEGAIYGLQLGTTREMIYKAIMEGINYEMKINLECLKDAGIHIDKLVAVGGGSTSKTLLQIKADILGIEISTLECNEAAALGCAILAAKAVGEYNSIGEAVKAMVRIKDTIYPNYRNLQTYQYKFNKYKTILERLKDINNPT